MAPPVLASSCAPMLAQGKFLPMPCAIGLLPIVDGLPYSLRMLYVSASGLMFGLSLFSRAV